MPDIRAIPGIEYARPEGSDVSAYIAPPYDVLDADSKAALLAQCPHNIVRIDLPHTPAKTVGPDAAYTGAGTTFREWLASGVLQQQSRPAIYIYQQTYTAKGQTFHRKGLIANVAIQPFGPGKDGKGGIFPHEQTFAAAKEDRLKLMRATKAQLSPIFGLYSDADESVGQLLSEVIRADEPTYFGQTSNDGVRHDVWVVDDAAGIDKLVKALAPLDVFIADGHHRYNTALNYHREVGAKPGDAADGCLFVLVAMQDPGMIVLPTHRVLGNLSGLTLEALKQKSAGVLEIEPFEGKDSRALEAALPQSGHHAMGLYIMHETGPQLAIARTVSPDPLAKSHGQQSAAWRQLDVAVLQHLIVEQILGPHFCAGGDVSWKFPHELSVMEQQVSSGDFQMGVVMQATPLESVQQVSEAGELMPQKSTFFYPKLATGLVINPLE